jgi:hypothetical protein
MLLTRKETDIQNCRRYNITLPAGVFNASDTKNAGKCEATTIPTAEMGKKAWFSW